jgi:diguanylate cyclase (GGDEF)-like protein
MPRDERTTNPSQTVVTVISQRRQIDEEAREGCLVIIYGDDLGRRVPLVSDGPMTIGRSSRCEVHVDQESVSRNHARIKREKGRFAIEDLDSTNGTYVNDELVEETVLRDGDQLKIGRTIFKFIVSNNLEAQYHEEIYRLMTVDGLTELHNKRYFNETLEKEISRARRYGRSFALVLFDIDHFKKINDTHGHLAGDSVLRQLGALIRGRVRRDDTPARTGGEEFGVIVPEAGEDAALLLAEKLREAVESATFRFEDLELSVTVSVGVTTWNAAGDEPQELLKRADDKLYEAKRSGRNRVCV